MHYFLNFGPINEPCIHLWYSTTCNGKEYMNAVAILLNYLNTKKDRPFFSSYLHEHFSKRAKVLFCIYVVHLGALNVGWNRILLLNINLLV